MNAIDEVKLEGGTLYIDNNAKEDSFKYAWEKDGQIHVSIDGVGWSNVSVATIIMSASLFYHLYNVWEK